MTRSFGAITYIWKGESAAAPANPAQNWVYRNSANKSVYLYDSGAWALMVKDGIDGTNGKTPEFQMSGNKLQWKYSTDSAWIDLITFPAYYAKPSGGIPKSDLADEVVENLDKAVSAVQPSALNDYAKKSEIPAVQQETDPVYQKDKPLLALKSEIPDVSNFATRTGVTDVISAAVTAHAEDGNAHGLTKIKQDIENLKNSNSGGGNNGGGNNGGGNGGGGYAPPVDGIPKTDLAQDIQDSLDKADSALQSFSETDPTVPDWAKASSKPDYTPSEIGAATAEQGNKADTAYQKPADGIPLNDLNQSVREGLDLANSALQSFSESDPVYTADKPLLAMKSDLTPLATIASLNGEIQDRINAGNALSEKIDEAKAIAEGGARARVFADEAELDAWLAVRENTDTLNVGDNFYIIETDVPDYWWDGTRKQKLETGKVDLAQYYTKTQIDILLSSKLDITTFNAALGQKADASSVPSFPLSAANGGTGANFASLWEAVASVFAATNAPATTGVLFGADGTGKANNRLWTVQQIIDLIRTQNITFTGTINVPTQAVP